MTQINSAFDIPRNTRVVPTDSRVAQILGRGKYVPTEGTVVGHAGRGGEYCLVKWDNQPSFIEETTHWMNIKLARVIKADQVREVQPHQFWAEASELGLKPGEWPEQLTTEIGNGMPLIRTSKKVEDGDLIYVRYHQANGCVDLRIMND